MELTVLAVPGCPNAPVLEQRLAELVAGRPGVRISRHVVGGGENAALQGMHGSPTLLIDGRDPFPAPAGPALACRLYPSDGGRLEGAPAVSALRQALAQAGLPEQERHAPVQPSLNGQHPAGGATADTAPRRASLLPGWTARRLWAASMIAVSAVAAIDAATGRRVVLIGLLIVGPCIALLTRRWLPATITGVWACGLAVLLGLPDGIWATGTHVAFIAATAIVAVAAAGGAAMIDRAGRRHGTERCR